MKKMLCLLSVTEMEAYHTTEIPLPLPSLRRISNRVLWGPYLIIRSTDPISDGGVSVTSHCALTRAQQRQYDQRLIWDMANMGDIGWPEPVTCSVLLPIL